MSSLTGKVADEVGDAVRATEVKYEEALTTTARVYQTLAFIGGLSVARILYLLQLWVKEYGDALIRSCVRRLRSRASSTDATEAAIDLSSLDLENLSEDSSIGSGSATFA